MSERRRGARAGNKNSQTHGHYALKQVVKELGSRAIDKRTSVGRALAEWKAAVAADLGGDLSTLQTEILELAVMNKLYVNSLDAWLATQPLVLKRKKTVIPVVMQRDTLAESLARQLMRLNSPELRRRTKQRTLKDYIEDVTNGEGSG